MKKEYNSPRIKIHNCNFERLLQEGSVHAKGWTEGETLEDFELTNGGGVGKGTTVVAGAKESNFIDFSFDE